MCPTHQQHSFSPSRLLPHTHEVLRRLVRPGLTKCPCFAHRDRTVLFRRRCDACKGRPSDERCAKYTVQGEGGAICTSDPSSFCERCFRALFYDDRGKLAVPAGASFRVFPHIHSHQ